jgi:hypothetical protein
MGPTTYQFQCRVCGFERYHQITVSRKNGAQYVTSFYACSRCSVMFLNPHQFNSFSDESPNVEMPKVVRLRAKASSLFVRWAARGKST